MKQVFLKQFCNTHRRNGVLELIQTKHKEMRESRTSLRGGGDSPRVLWKFTQQELVCMCLDNFFHDCSSTLMPQTFRGFNDLCKEGHDIGIHKNKSKKSAKEGGKAGHWLRAVVVPKQRTLYVVRPSCSEKVNWTKSRIVRNATEAAVLVSYQNVPSATQQPFHRGLVRFQGKI